MSRWVPMVPRTLQRKLLELSRGFPIVTLTGPRQAGKSTLIRLCFPNKAYVNLEALDLRQFATEDPRGFLAGYPDGAIFDEVQRVPDLLSYLQVAVDAAPHVRGHYILTGSQHFGLLQQVSQSLAGRSAMLELLPMAYEELAAFSTAPSDLFDTLLMGGYPAIFERGLAPADWLSSYLATYVERDIRQLVNVTDTLAFRGFLALCAGSSGQLLNFSRLGADAGITHNTARAWLSAMEASYICFRLPPKTSSTRKAVTKTPKLYFYDVGLLCHLLGIRQASELRHHPLRGAIFETWVASELVRHQLHRGQRINVSFYRNRRGLEVDFLLEQSGSAVALEAKSGATVAGDFFATLNRFAEEEPSFADAVRGIIHGGDARQDRSQGTFVLPWHQLHEASFWERGL